MFRPCYVQKANFTSLASTCKLLRLFRIRLDGSTSSLLGISKLSNLVHLEVLANLSDPGGLFIPREIGGLSKLEVLEFKGQQVVGKIPTEIGELRALKELMLSRTNLTSRIPTELGNLSQLSQLYLSNNDLLHGELPQEMNELSMLEVLNLSSTPSVTRRLFKLEGAWQDGVWHKTK